MVKKKFLLISPMNPLGDGSSFPPLGLATIARYIPEDYDVRIFDEGVEGRIDTSKIFADIVGISANTLTARRAYEISKEFIRKKVPTVLGGIHPTVRPDEAMEHATSVVVGNGEPSMCEILEDFENGRLRKKYEPPIFDISKSLNPRRDLLNGRYKTGSIQTSRGCPFNCKFCSVHKVHGSKYRVKPLDVVRRDAESLDTEIILIVDDNFFGAGLEAEARTGAVLDILKENKIKWIGQTSINIANNEKILKKCRKSGAIAFYIGFESLNDDFLKSVRKTVNLKLAVKSYGSIINKIHDNGICVLGSFIYGTDFDTRDSLKMLRDFIVESDIDTTYVKPLTPFPGTDIYVEMIQQGRLFNSTYWLEDPYPVFTYKPEKLSMDELLQASLDFMELYTLPNSILRFGKSLLATGNFWGSAMSFLTNYGDYKMYKAYYCKMQKQANMVRHTI